MPATVTMSPLVQSTSSLLFTTPPPNARLQVSVIVPVRNEACHLTHTLDALRLQQDNTGSPLPPDAYEVLLLTNNCTDHSYDIALRYQQQYPTFALHLANVQLPPHQANIGTVRRMLMDAAHDRLTGLGKPDGIIASTDGDTVVDSRWLYYTMREITNGNDAVGGRILTHPDSSQVRLFHLRDVMYRTLVARAEALFDPNPHDPWPRHFQHFGASIAVTCRMYERAGRLPEKPFLEDEAFYRALLRTDARIRQSPDVKVFTSTRQQGQVEVGFSEQLRYWSAMQQANQCQMTESTEAVIRRLRNRQRLRQCWRLPNAPARWATLTAIAGELLLDEEWLRKEVDKHLFFGQLWEAVDEKMNAEQWASRWPAVPITEAIQQLRTYVNTEGQAAFQL